MPGFELGKLGLQGPRLPNVQFLRSAAILSLDIYEGGHR